MTHEFKSIVAAYSLAQKQGVNCVLASVVALEGTSYRRPGVRMLILEDGSTVGAVSGGCVEKEVIRQAQAVFQSGTPRTMVYDGRYRLGCDGQLYLLLEPFRPNETLLVAFKDIVENRKVFKLQSFFERTPQDSATYGTWISFGTQPYPLNAEQTSIPNGIEIFEQPMPPCFRLLLLGAEHDAVQLCQFAAATGWEVTVVASPDEEKSKKHFPGASQFIAIAPEQLAVAIDQETAVMVMSHSFSKDLRYVIALKETNPGYFGLLGPSKRREKLFDALLERCPELSDTFLDLIHGPAGLHIGAETPQEIAIAVLAEILAVVRGKQPDFLKEKSGKIHS